MSFSFEKLQVYQNAIDFADCVCQHCEQFPRGYAFLIDQLNRAALSIAANLAEGTYSWGLNYSNSEVNHALYASQLEIARILLRPPRLPIMLGQSLA